MSQIRVSHILQKHVGSRNPKDSYRKRPVTRSKEEAIENIKKFREEVMKNADTMADTWKLIAQNYSECSSAARGGDLGYFGHGMMQKAFEDAAYSLEVGQVSDIVDSDSGIHIIWRTA